MKRNDLSARKNIIAVFFALVIGFVALSCGLAYNTLIRGDELAAKAESTRTRSVTVAASRGAIYDRNGETLAVSVSADSVAVNPSSIKESELAEVAEFLSETLDITYDTIYSKLTADTTYEWIQRKADFGAAAAIEAANYSGVMLVEETQRFYPKNELSANVLGFAGVDNQGLEGIEFSFDELLSGTDGSIVTEYDSKNQIIQEAIQEYNAPVDGYNLYLTIDENIQYFAERELDVLMASEDAPVACAALAMNPQTGEILAMANRPTYDPNSYQDSEVSERRNMLITDVYEPGSTFKIITAAAALDSGAATTESRFYDPGYAQVGSFRINCWRSTPHGSESFAEIIQNSCNPGFVALVQMMEDLEGGIFHEYIEAFGFGSTTGLGLQGESKGIVIPYEDAIPLDLATMSIGQSIAVTPLQLVTAVSAVANGGMLLTPQIIHHVTDSEGNIIDEFEVEEVRQVVSEEVANTVTLMLESVVTNGTGSNAYIEGFRVGGKSGTAQIPGVGGYEEDAYIASFISVAPVDDPQVVLLVIVDQPQGDLTQGGQVAAPVNKLILEDTLRYLGVVPQVIDVTDTKVETEAKNYVSVPDLTNLYWEDAVKVLQVAGLSYETTGNYDYVTSQTPAAFSQVEVGTTVVLTTGGETGVGEVVVPDLTGKLVREVAEITSAMGLKVKTSGSGIVTEQLPIPGTVVKTGDVINVTFEEEEVEEYEDTDIFDELIDEITG